MRTGLEPGEPGVDRAGFLFASGMARIDHHGEETSVTEEGEGGVERGQSGLGPGDDAFVSRRKIPQVEHHRGPSRGQPLRHGFVSGLVQDHLGILLEPRTRRADRVRLDLESVDPSLGSDRFGEE